MIDRERGADRLIDRDRERQRETDRLIDRDRQTDRERGEID